MARKQKVICISLCLVLVASIAAVSFVSMTAFGKEYEFSVEDQIKIAHLTDTHYYPISYCNKNNLDFISVALTKKQQYLESSQFNYKVLMDVIEESPDYLFVTGDLTINGELQGHIEYSNLLRFVQNTIRQKQGNDNFQIFVTPGNHDLYNQMALRFDTNPSGELAPNITRKQFTKLYAGLGYPDMTDGEMSEFYASLYEVLDRDLPYTPDEGYLFVNSKLSSKIEFAYQYEGMEDLEDYDNSYITYVAYARDGYAFFCFDEEISNSATGHITAGKIYPESYEFMKEQKSSGRLDNTKTMIALLHHNIVPHFDNQDKLTKDFPLWNWQESADFFADFGIHYAFTGHTHANDIANYISFNNNPIMDIETSSVTGYKGSMRIVNFQRGKVGVSYADNLNTKLVLVNNADITKVVEYAGADYFTKQNVDDYVELINGRYICIDVSEYCATRFLRNLIDYGITEYISPSFIMGLSNEIGSMVGQYFPDMVDSIDSIYKNVIRHVEEEILKDYVYSGTNSEFKKDEQGCKIGGFLDEIMTKVLNTKVNSSGLTLKEFGVEGYLTHVGSRDLPYTQTSLDILEALENLRNGSVIQQILDTILYYNGGLTLIVEGLTRPIDISIGLPEEQIEGLNVLVGMIAQNNKVDIRALKIDDLLFGVLELVSLSTDFSLDIDLNNKTIWEFASDALDSYVTDSLYAGLGEIAASILEAFYIDETPDGCYESFVNINPNNLKATFVADMELFNEPSIENGKLPSMLTITFGDDPKTQKNFVWFTDPRVKDGVVEYNEGGFDETRIARINGEFSVYATTTAGIDLGVYSTLIETEIGRHTASIDGLKPNTVYSYRVGSLENGWYSEVGQFKTAPGNNDAFEALLLTDLQGFANSTYVNADRILNNIDGAFELGYDFVINCGDAVDNSANLMHYQYLKNTMKKHWANTTQVIAAGNHEMHNYVFKNDIESAWRLPTPDVITSSYNYFALHYNIAMPEQDTVKAMGVHYSFDYSGVHFVVLNTNDIIRNKLSDNQTEWLINDLKQTDKKFKVVVMHKGIYTAGAHNSDPDVVGLRRQLTPIFADNGVNLVLQGHDHTYTESYYLDRDGEIVNKNASGQYKLGDEGVLYVTLGTLGDKFYKYTNDYDLNLEFGESKHSPTLTKQTFGKLYYDGESLYYMGYEYDLETDKFSEIRKDTMPEWLVAVISITTTLGIYLIVGVAVYFVRKRGV